MGYFGDGDGYEKEPKKKNLTVVVHKFSSRIIQNTKRPTKKFSSPLETVLFFFFRLLLFNHFEIVYSRYSIFLVSHSP